MEALNWYCYEKQGSPIFKRGDPKSPILRKGDLQEGETIWVPGLFGGYHELVVDLAKSTASDGKVSTQLTHDGTEWAAMCLVNLESVRKLSLSSIPQG